uniref:Uncharacterized protein n=1 Tax=Anguilla anguilla TaxID=7936 RepID=A0A0E9X0U6_ANGAN
MSQCAISKEKPPQGRSSSISEGCSETSLLNPHIKTHGLLAIRLSCVKIFEKTLFSCERPSISCQYLPSCETSSIRFSQCIYEHQTELDHGLVTFES